MFPCLVFLALFKMQCCLFTVRSKVFPDYLTAFLSKGQGFWLQQLFVGQFLRGSLLHKGISSLKMTQASSSLLLP